MYNQPSYKKLSPLFLVCEITMRNNYWRRLIVLKDLVLTEFFFGYRAFCRTWHDGNCTASVVF